MYYVSPSEEAIRNLQGKFGYGDHCATWFPISSSEMLIAALDAYVPQYSFWGLDLDHSRPVQSLIDAAFHPDVRMREAKLYLVRHQNRVRVVRTIRTVSVRIIYKISDNTMLHPGLGKRVRLKEYRIRNGISVPRKHSFTSASETMRLHESPIDALIRLLLEELRMRVEPRHLQPPYLIPLTQNEADTVLMSQTYDPFDHIPGTNPSDKFPGIPTLNDLLRYLWDMPRKYFQVIGYKERGNNSIHLWDNLESYLMND